MEDDKRLEETVAASVYEQQAKLEEAKRARIEAEMRMKKLEQRTETKRNAKAAFGRLPKTAKIGLSVVLVALVLVVFGIVLPIAMDDHRDNDYITVAKLKDAVNIENLAAVDYTYEGIAEKKSPFLWTENVDYRVKYESHVRANYKMSEIEFTIDEAGKKITAYLPEPEISSPVLDETKFGYLPENITADIKDVLALCKEDAAKDVNVDMMRAEGLESLKNIITALTMPLLGDDWNLEFKDLSEYTPANSQEVYDEAQ